MPPTHQILLYTLTAIQVCQAAPVGKFEPVEAPILVTSENVLGAVRIELAEPAEITGVRADLVFQMIPLADFRGRVDL